MTSDTVALLVSCWPEAAHCTRVFLRWTHYVSADHLTTTSAAWRWSIFVWWMVKQWYDDRRQVRNASKL